MVLRVTNNEETYGIDTYKISTENFANKIYHPMIATTNWDKVYIDVDENMPRGIIKQLLKFPKVVPVFVTKTLSPRQLQVLCEIVPDDAGKLRSLYMRDKEEFYHLCTQLSE